MGEVAGKSAQRTEVEYTQLNEMRQQLYAKSALLRAGDVQVGLREGGEGEEADKELGSGLGVFLRSFPRFYWVSQLLLQIMRCDSR